ncbi:uncharacterized protein TNCV_5086921 [Trichonephila clavipes]|nr:uncharacterized protein TNCV_5086921 [Trichonephila clavipes]
MERANYTRVSAMTIHRRSIELTLTATLSATHACTLDESHSQLCPDDRRGRVWRRPEKRADPVFTIARHTSLQPGLMLVKHFLGQPDFSTIEHVWDMMGRRLHLPGNVDDLAGQLQQIWQEIPRELIRGLYHSMPRCVAACIQERRFSSDKNSKYLINMPRFCNKTFKRRKFGSSNYSSASEDLKNGQEQPANSSENFCEIIDIPLFSSVLKQHVLCVKCKKQGIDIKFGRQIQGLATELLICCEFCGLIQPLLNTRFTNTVVNKKDTKVYEVNTRLAYAMRSVGKGEAAAKVFCGVMNLPPPPKRFYESLHALNNATEKVAKVSMALAAAETLSFNNVSVDTGKVIDAEILSRKCSCHFNGNLHSDECSANYFGNSGGMEVEGALRIFNRSEVLHNLRYTQYLGDGDSKAYKAVLESKPYKDVNIEKLECVGHVEKRMGTRLRALKLKLKGKKLEDKKSLGGRNRLTDAEIDKLQRYYGLAIRNNSGNLSAMKQAIWAIFLHKISTDLNPQHMVYAPWEMIRGVDIIGPN